jgi:anti-sigma-K factor RskA
MSGDADSLAGEYVLGVLDAQEMAAVRRQAEADAALAADIAAWEARLAPLAALAAPVAPPAALWRRIEASADGRDRILTRAWRNAAVWRGATAASLALAAALAILAVIPRATPVMLVALDPAGGPASSFLARVNPDGTLQVRALGAIAVPGDRDMEVWALAAGAARPVPLGLLTQAGGRMPVGSLAAPGTQILVSLEPKGGSPTGLPTGPVLYGGRMTVLD